MCQEMNPDQALSMKAVHCPANLARFVQMQEGQLHPVRAASPKQVPRESHSRLKEMRAALMRQDTAWKQE